MRRVLTNILFIAGFATMQAGCASSASTEVRHSQGGVAEAREQLEASQPIRPRQAAELFRSAEGRDTLRSWSGQFDNVFYDGNERFAQLTNVTSFAYDEPVVSLVCYSGHLYPDYAVSRPILLPGISLDSEIDVEFAHSSMILTGPVPGQGLKSFEINWSQGQLPQGGVVNFQTAQVSLNP